MTLSSADPTVAAAPIPILSGIGAIADRYDGFVIDLWGVLYDGVKPFPGVIETLDRLRARGKRVLLLTNAPRRALLIVRRLERAGLPHAHYDDLISSGEAAFEALQQRAAPWAQGLGRRIFFAGSARDPDVVNGLGLIETQNVDEADFLYSVGVDSVDESLDRYRDVLARAAARRLVFVCANPDLAVIHDGQRGMCAGTLAAHYETLGGAVHYFGKPYPAVYEAAFARLGLKDRGQVVAVGDSLRTDIAGARAFGFDALLVLGGMHREELGLGVDARPGPAELGRLCARFGQRPTAAVPAFRWSANSSGQ
ncbi:MAG: TIGR01459 family HAD-type hydrolase [Alphaproteobacteria bacterium]